MHLQQSTRTLSKARTSPPPLQSYLDRMNGYNHNPVNLDRFGLPSASQASSFRNIHQQHQSSIPDTPEYAVNVPLLVGLVSGFGTLLLGLLCGILWFVVLGRRTGRIRLPAGSEANPGDFDDEAAYAAAEEEALLTMDPVNRMYHDMAKAFILSNPPNSVPGDISLSQYLSIQEKGVSAWEFDVEFPGNSVWVENRTDLEFLEAGAAFSVQTNLPVPRHNEVYYWETKVYDKPDATTLSVGLTTRPYPSFRLPGYHRYSMAYDSFGVKRHNHPFSAPQCGPPLQRGDVVGVGYRPRSGTVFFTRNGKRIESHASDTLKDFNLFPTVGATGPCRVSVNFGQAGFVYIEANVKKWGLAPVVGSLAPPPPYGKESESELLEAGRTGADSDADDDNEPAPSTSQGSAALNIHPTRDNVFRTSNSPPPFHSSFFPVSSSTGGIINISLHSLDMGGAARAAEEVRLLEHTPPPSYESESEVEQEQEQEQDEDEDEDEEEDDEEE